MLHRSLASGLLVLALGCDGSVVGPMTDGGAPLPRCEAMITPITRDFTVAPRSVAVISVTGGTGRPRFALDSDGATGSRVNRSTGVFVAGDIAGHEVVRISDERCEDDAVVRVEVTEALTLAPAMIEIAPGTTVTFRPRGGSGGEVRFDLTRDTSGASLSAAGVYVAGATEGADRVRATDLDSGATAESSVLVRAGAGFSVTTTRLGIPVGSRHVITARGGSGEIDVTSSGSAFLVDGTAVTASAAGDATLTVRDRFTDAETTIAATAMASRTASSTWVGDRSELNNIVIGDFDQDGRNDAAVALPGSNHAAYRAGAVLIFPGASGGGLMNRPARIIAGLRRDDAFGSALATGDLDGDGVDELIVGAWQDDAVGSNAGSVFVYQGITGRMFDDEPYLSLFGVSAGDRFGISVTACDFDGDGDVDLAVGAADDEDNSIAPALSNQGAVHVFSSYDGRILGRADLVLFGSIPDGAGGFTSHRDMRFGSAIASGDVDGDDRCDLFVHSQRPDPATSNDGMISVFRGAAPAMGRTEGTVSPVPNVVWAAMETGRRGSRFGAFLAVGDLDGDALTDLAVGAPSYDRPAMGSDAAVTDLGAVMVFSGGSLADRAMAITPATDADLLLEGMGSSAILGHGVAIGDVDGDRTDDLVVGQSRANVMDVALSRPGVVNVHSGVRGAMPSITPARTVVGVGADERFGNGLGVIGMGGIAILAPFFDGDGLDVGGMYLSLPSSLTPVALPARPSGRRLGQSVAIVGDLTGDGRDDLVVGAPHQPDPSGMRRGIDYGAAYVYAGEASGFASAPTASLAGYTFATNAGHSESDWVGEVVASAGDFDGDGRADVAVVARFEDLPASFDVAQWVVDPACSGTRNNPGAVLVYSGVASGALSGQPSFVYFAPQADRTIQMVAGDLDVNGDGLDDLIVGGANWLSTDAAAERRGGYAVVLGRAREAGGLSAVSCTSDAFLEGSVINDELGYSATGLGDLDGDGCDEVAIGARLLDRTGSSDEGGVHILFGFGAACTSSTPRSIVLVPNDRTSWAGTAVAGGVDLDGGGVPDLVVGAPRYTSALGEVGRVYLLSGERIRAQAGASTPIPFASVAVTGTWYLDGEAPGERLGWSVAIVESSPRAVAMGGLYANLSGVPNAGGVRVVRVAAGGFGAYRALLVGETIGAYPEFGASLSSRGSWLSVGASWGGGDVLEEGSAYVFQP